VPSGRAASIRTSTAIRCRSPAAFGVGCPEPKRPARSTALQYDPTWRTIRQVTAYMVGAREADIPDSETPSRYLRDRRRDADPG